MPGPTLIQIKRSLNTATPSSLANGEFAYSSNGDALFIGANGVIVPVAGKRVPGVLTANQAIVTNSTNMIDTVMIGNTSVNAVVNSSSIKIANSTQNITLIRPDSTQAAGNYYLKADGSWSTVSAGSAAPAGGNTHVQYNDSGVTAGVAAFTYDEVSNNVSVANSLVTGTSTVNAVVNSTGLTIGNSTVTYLLQKPTAAQVTAADYYHASDSTWKQIAAPASTLDNLTDVTIASVANNQLLVYDAIATQWENHSVGNGFSFVSQDIAVLGGVGHIVNTTGVHVLANNGIIANSTGTFVNPGTSGGLTVNSTGVWAFANQGLIVNSTGFHVLANNGIVANSTGTWAKEANGTSVTAAGINVNVATTSGLSVNTTGVWVIANAGLVTNSTGLHIGAANGITVGTDTVGAVVGSTLTLNTTGIHVNSTLSIQDLSLGGNLNVTGTLVTVDATNLVVNDSIISLGRNNGADVLDIGFFGQYNDGTERFTGLIYDTSPAGNIYELFANSITEPTTTLDTGATGYVRAMLYAYAKSGWGTGTLEANTTGVWVTANSTWSATIAANTLSLSTALPGTSGGTGLATIADQAILKGNATNGYTALALGTAGLVLQSFGGALIYDTLDGGTF